MKGREKKGWRESGRRKKWGKQPLLEPRTEADRKVLPEKGVLWRGRCSGGRAGSSYTPPPWTLWATQEQLLSSESRLTTLSSPNGKC